LISVTFIDLPELPGLALQRLAVIAEALDEVLCLSGRDIESFGEVADFVFLPASDANSIPLSGLAFVVGHSRPPAQVLGKVDKLRKFRDLLLEKLRVAAGLDV
jgi:hypothetical protein